jgi:hypothetical protein
MSPPGASLPPRLSRLRVRLLSLKSFNSSIAQILSLRKRAQKKGGIFREGRPMSFQTNWRI